MKKTLAAAIFLALMTTRVFALTIHGDHFNVTLNYPSLSAAQDLGNFQVAPNQNTFDLAAGAGAVVVQDDNVLIHFYIDTTFAAAAFNGFVVTDTDENFPGIFSVDPNSSSPGFSQARVTVSGNKLEVNLAGYSPVADGNVYLLLQPAVAAVPEPATYAMWLAGLAMAIGLVRRRAIA